MDWFKNRADTLTIIGFIVGAVVWTNLRFSSVENDITMIKTTIAKFPALEARFSDFEARFYTVEKDVAVIKTVMIMNHHMPCELAKENQEK